MTAMTGTVLFTGKTLTTNAAGKGSAHGNIDLRLTTPSGTDYTFEDVASHPTAEQLFAGAWSACYVGALGLVSMQKKVKLPADMSVGIEVDLVQRSGTDFVLRARFDVALPGLDQATAEAIAHEADLLCPYSKAVRGNIDVALSVRTS
jgi:Ohr subfamily peroxiredoxin